MKSTWLLAACAAVVVACSDDSNDGPPPVSFAQDVHPILEEKCSDCHSDIHGNPNVDEAYQATISTLPGSDAPLYELILQRTMSEDPSRLMPPSFASPPCEAFGEGGCLTQEEWDTISAWVEDGLAP